MPSSFMGRVQGSNRGWRAGRLRGIALVAWLVAGPVPLEAGELYRYENDDGVVVLDHHVPPEFVHKGYTVLSENGRVLRVVPRQLSPEEIRARDAAEAEARRAQAEFGSTDEDLLRMYSSAEDVERARDRQVASIQGLINTTRGNIQRLRIQKRNLEADAARMERAGNPVTPEILENLRIIDIQIREKEAEVDGRVAEQEQIRVRFERYQRRVEELLYQKASNPTG